jgi:hypothetical protein
MFRAVRPAPRGSPDRRRKYRAPILLLLAALVTGAVSFEFVQAATGFPSATLFGSIQVYCSDPNVSTTVEAEFFRSFEDLPDGGREFKGGIDDTRVMEITVTVHSTKGPRRNVSCVLVLAYGAIMSDTYSSEGTAVRVADDRITESFAGGGDEEFRNYGQVVVGGFDLSPGQDGGLYVSGRLSNSASKTIAGLTLVSLPSLGEYGPVSSVTFGPRYALGGGAWYIPADHSYEARLGPLKPGTKLDFSEPAAQIAADSQGRPDLDWTGDSLRDAQATLSNGLEQQQANKRLFVAGALAGVSGSLLIEAALRTRPFEERKQRRPRSKAWQRRAIMKALRSARRPLRKRLRARASRR